MGAQDGRNDPLEVRPSDGMFTPPTVSFTNEVASSVIIGFMPMEFLLYILIMSPIKRFPRLIPFFAPASPLARGSNPVANTIFLARGHDFVPQSKSPTKPSPEDSSGMSHSMASFWRVRRPIRHHLMGIYEPKRINGLRIDLFPRAQSY